MGNIPSCMKTWALAVCALTLLTSCQSLRPFPPDGFTSTRWLIINFGDFSNSSRTMVTDNEIVIEHYKRINSGRRNGEHTLKEQDRTPLPPTTAEKFWRQVDSMNLFSWSNSDIPPWTNYPSLSYQNNKREISLRSSGLAQPRDKRFEALLELIGKFGKQSDTP
jgi:hypothetical protein